MSRNSSKRVERSDWLAWRRGLFDRRATLERLPSFSDCAIQHPESVWRASTPRFMQVSASIRYASRDDWLLVKGRKYESQSKNRLSSSRSSRTHLVYGQLQNVTLLALQHCAGCTMATVLCRWHEGSWLSRSVAENRHNSPYHYYRAGRPRFSAVALR